MRARVSGSQVLQQAEGFHIHSGTCSKQDRNEDVDWSSLHLKYMTWNCELFFFCQASWHESGYFTKQVPRVSCPV